MYKAICGGWSGWSEWSACSASCGEGGLVTRERLCDSPAPEYGGAPCEGDGTQKRSCTGRPCREFTMKIKHSVLFN